MKHLFCKLLVGIVALAAGFGCLAAEAKAGKAGALRPASVSAEAKADLARYSFRAYDNGNPTNRVKALLYTPKPVGMNALPMVVYLPGRGEIGEIELQFRQRAIFDRVTSREFQEKYPCFLLALTPPATATTLLGGMPKHPTGLQRAMRDFVLEIAKAQTRPKVDLDRLYLTGFSYGGNGAYALGQHFPGMFAAVVPVASLPPLTAYFAKDAPGNWWHFHNEGDWSRHGMGPQLVDEFAKLVSEAGGDFRLGTFPDEGHDAWSKAWREDAVWDWMFSKSLKGPVKQLTKQGRKAEPVSVPLSSAVCTASVLGSDAGHGPERVVDGLDATWYEAASPFTKGDWWQVDLVEPIRGRFMFATGDGKGAKTLRDAFVETSADGRRWTLAASFSNKDGTCSFLSRGKVRFLRVKSRAAKPQPVCLRRLKVFKDGK